jgi:hypothetical protein
VLFWEGNDMVDDLFHRQVEALNKLSEDEVQAMKGTLLSERELPELLSKSRVDFLTFMKLKRRLPQVQKYLQRQGLWNVEPETPSPLLTKQDSIPSPEPAVQLVSFPKVEKPSVEPPNFAATEESKLRKVEIPAPLMDEILRGNCVLFLGAGVSLEAGMPSSQRLVQTLGYGSAVSLAEAAQSFEGERSRLDLVQVIRRAFEDANKYAQTAKASHPFIANILQLNSLIVTTNYDTLLEDALRQEGKTPVIVCRERELGSVTGQPHVIVKLHGDLNQPDTMVITQGDYDHLGDRLRAPGGFSSYLANLLSTKTMIFVGSSLADEDFQRIWTSVAAKMVDAANRSAMRVHYAVGPWGKEKAKGLENLITNIKVVQAGAEAFFAAIFRRTSEFLNRTLELRQICEVHQEEPFIEIVGPAGSGKTMLLKGIETFYRLRRDLSVISIALMEQETPETLLWRLAERHNLDLNIDAREEGQKPDEILRKKAQKLVEGIQGTSVLFAFDGTEKAPRLVSWLERELLPELREKWNQRLGSGRVIFAGRQPFPWQPLTRLHLHTLPLTPFQPRAVEEMISKYFILFRKEVLSPRERKRIRIAILQLTGTGHAGFIKAILEEIADTKNLPKNQYPSAVDLVRYLEERADELIEQRLMPLLREDILKDADPSLMQLLEDALCIFRALNTSILKDLPQRGLESFGVDESRCTQPEPLIQNLKGLHILGEPSRENPMRRLDPVVGFLLSARLRRKEPEQYCQAHETALGVFDGGVQRADTAFRLAYAGEGLYHLQCLREIDSNRETLVQKVKHYLEHLESSEDPIGLASQWKAMIQTDTDLRERLEAEAKKRSGETEEKEKWMSEVYSAVDAAFDEFLA